MIDPGISNPDSESQEKLLYESDWLGSEPFYYNIRTGRADHNINAVIDLANLEFDPEGLNDYLDFGYCVFEHTPVKDVHLLRYSSRLLTGPAGIRVEYLDDPTREWFDRSSTVDEVLEVATSVLDTAVQGVKGEIVVPTSGGLDSRFINLLISDRSRVRTFTYGVNDRPNESQEVVKARELARRLGLKWETIEIGEFHRYLEDWDALYGPSVHAHGMYQMEFYHKILPRVAPASTVISGAFGDTLAGENPRVSRVRVLEHPDDLLRVFRFGQMCADSKASVFTSQRLGWQKQIDEDPRLRTELLPRLVTEMRLQAPLFSYLYTAPRSLGLECRAPFIDAELARRMLTLPWEIRDERRWQRVLFRHKGLDLEGANLPGDWRNTLNLRAIRRVPLRPLDPQLLREIIKPEYVRWVNRNVGPLGLPWEVLTRLSWTHGFRRFAAALRCAGLDDQRMPAYFAYLTLRPLESLLLRRNQARGGRSSTAPR